MSESSGSDGVLDRIRSRIGRFLWTADPGLVTGPEVAADIAAVLSGLRPPLDGPAAREAGATGAALAWLRYLVLPAGGGDRAALGVAAGMYEMLEAADPALGVEPLRELCAALRQPGADPLPLCQHWCERHDAVKDGLLAWTMEAMAATGRVRAAGLSQLAQRLAASPAGTYRRGVVIAALRTAIEASDAADPDQALRLSNLAGSLEDRYDQTGEVADLDDAVTALHQAVALRHPEHGAHHLSNLSGALQRRYMRTAAPADLTEALATARQAVRAGPGEASHRHNLASALALAYQTSGRPEELTEAIAQERAALANDATAPAEGTGTSRRRAAMLSELGICLRASYDLTGHDADLDESVRVQRDAIGLTADADVAMVAIRYNALGTALTTRYSRSGREDDLALATGAYEQALASAPAGFPHAALLLSNLGGARRTRYERQGHPADLDAAAGLIAQAYASSRADDPRIYLYGVNLGSVLLLKYRASRDPAELDQAVAVLNVVTTDREPGADPRTLAAALATLGTALAGRYDRDGQAADGTAAAAACRQAIALTPPGDARRDSYATSLASIMWSQVRPAAGATGQEGAQATLAGDSPADREAALAALAGAAASPGVATSARIGAAELAAALCAQDGDWPQAAGLLRDAVALLPLTAPREQDRTDQEHWLGKFTDLAADAAACALAAQDPDGALSVLEAGRGIMLARAFRLRDTSTGLAGPGLADAAPDLAARFEAIRAALDEPAPLPHLSEGGTGGPLRAFDLTEARARRRRQLLAELDRLIARVRALPGRAGFLAPPSVAELAGAAAAGPVVFVNVSGYRSDALVLTAGGLRPPVPLPGLRPGDVAARAGALLAAVAGPPAAEAAALGLAARAQRHDQDQRTVQETLDWLAASVVHPVLGALGHTATPGPGQPWPRLWWAPVGRLSYLPLHAAGDALDRVISSYTPTGFALLEARRRARGDEAGDRDGTGLAVVAMPSTDGAAGLPGAGREAGLLAARFPAAAILGSWPGAAGPATRESVLGALRGHACVHFACHGQCDLAEPANSLLLVSGPEPLRVADLAALNLAHARFAYLSACETAQTAPALTNEAQHLVAAFGLAGYPAVIGTLWRVNDSAAFSIAQSVYDVIAPPGQPLDPARAATALHAAARDLRDRYPDTPGYWAAHLHAGA